MILTARRNVIVFLPVATATLTKRGPMIEASAAPKLPLSSAPAPWRTIGGAALITGCA